MAITLPVGVPTPFDIEPSTLQVEDLQRVLRWAYEVGASDVILMTDDRVAARLHGRYARVTHRRLTQPEIQRILGVIYAENGPALVSGGSPLDFSYEFSVSRESKLRFRVNATAGATRLSTSGLEIVFRVIPESPPTFEEIALEQEIVRAHREIAKTQGLVMVVGATGTGKSTTLAAMISDAVATAPLKVLTYEAPIEFQLSPPGGTHQGLVIQTEVPRHVKTFADGVSNALRRAPNIIMVGEMRDRETMMGGVQACLTGHAVYTTLHANSVAAALPRMLGEFPPGEQRGLLARLLDVLRLIMTQRLVPTVDGRRIALREWLVLDQSIREELAFADLDRLQPLLHRMVRDRRQSLLCAAERVADRLAPGQMELIAAEWKGAHGDGHGH